MFNLVSHHDQIWEIKNFLSEEEISYFWKIIEDTEEASWFSEDSGAPPHWVGRNLTLHQLPEVIGVKTKIESSFLNHESVNELNSILRYRNSESLGQHKDNTEPSDYNNIFGIVIYLNDNYEGGEIYYPDLGITIKPTKGSMVIHGAGILHGVKPVVGGAIRYVLTTFVKGDRDTKFIGDVIAV